MKGSLIHLNTLEDFKSFDKTSCLLQEAHKLHEDIIKDRVEMDPSLFSPFVVIIYADLKNYRFNYWFAFLALASRVPYRLISSQVLGEVWAIEEVNY